MPFIGETKEITIWGLLMPYYRANIGPFSSHELKDYIVPFIRRNIGLFIRVVTGSIILGKIYIDFCINMHK